MIFPKRRRGFSILVALLLLLTCSLLPFGAKAHDRHAVDTPVVLPFGPSEELVYEGEFTRALLRGIDIADLRFTAVLEPASGGDDKSQGGRAGKSLRLTVDAVSKGLLSKLFKLRFRQRIESTVDPVSFAVLQTTKLDEQGDRLRTSQAVFDRAAGKVVWTERDPNNPSKEPRVISSNFSGAVQDLASIFYFLRTRPLTPGSSFEIAISDSGRIYRLPVKVGEKKMMKTVLGEVPVLRVEPEVFGEGLLLRGRGKVSIWFTDDARRIPVRAHISNEMGTLDIKLKSINGGAKT
ncbi:MAG TPA: DUF3108 domain-containing protein [Pyrinomonadaceae bacterium]|jgi:hypothetical protein|nr:DUF3108 domain-containing protein [Pyrinomonadaceae bacterium]